MIISTNANSGNGNIKKTIYKNTLKDGNPVYIALTDSVIRFFEQQIAAGVSATSGKGKADIFKIYIDTVIEEATKPGTTLLSDGYPIAVGSFARTVYDANSKCPFFPVVVQTPSDSGKTTFYDALINENDPLRKAIEDVFRGADGVTSFKIETAKLAPFVFAALVAEEGKTISPRGFDVDKAIGDGVVKHAIFSDTFTYNQMSTAFSAMYASWYNMDKKFEEGKYYIFSITKPDPRTVTASLTNMVFEPDEDFEYPEFHKNIAYGTPESAGRLLEVNAKRIPELQKVIDSGIFADYDIVFTEPREDNGSVAV